MHRCFSHRSLTFLEPHVEGSTYLRPISRYLSSTWEVGPEEVEEVMTCFETLSEHSYPLTLLGCDSQRTVSGQI